MLRTATYAAKLQSPWFHIETLYVSGYFSEFRFLFFIVQTKKTAFDPTVYVCLHLVLAKRSTFKVGNPTPDSGIRRLKPVKHIRSLIHIFLMVEILI